MHYGNGRGTVFAAALGLALEGLGGNSALAQDKELVISTWGYNGDLLQEHLYKPFEEQHGVKIVLETGNNADRLNKIRIRGGVDLVYLADSFVQTGIEQGLFAPVDRSRIPNIAELHEVAQAPHGEEYGPAYTIGRFGIIYDTAATDTPVTSWQDLWREEFKGRVTVPNISTTAGPLMVLVAADKEGVSAFEDPDGAFRALEELQGNILTTYSRSSELANLFAQGEVVIAAAQDFVFSNIKQSVPTAAWAELDEGAFANLNTINLVKGGNNPELAMEFINWHLNADVQKALAVAKVDAPVNAKVELTPEEAAPWTYGEEVVQSLNKPDYAALNANLEDWTERWNEMFRQ